MAIPDVVTTLDVEVLESDEVTESTLRVRNYEGDGRQVILCIAGGSYGVDAADLRRAIRNAEEN